MLKSIKNNSKEPKTNVLGFFIYFKIFCVTKQALMRY